jgi:DNA polymerase III epsilon subunit-like protein
MRTLVFDTETTGLPKTQIISPETLNTWPHVVQFSYIIFDTESNKIVKIKDCIIKVPDNVVITEENSKIHGITTEISMTKGVSLKPVLEEFFEDLNTADHIVGHNVSFDINMIKVELNRLIVETLDVNEVVNLHECLTVLKTSNNIYCTMQESIELCNIEMKDKFGRTYKKFPKLVELYQKMFNVTPKNLHNSLNDVIVCLRCFIKLKYYVDIVEHSPEVKQMIKDYL